MQGHVRIDATSECVIDLEGVIEDQGAHIITSHLLANGQDHFLLPTGAVEIAVFGVPGAGISQGICPIQHLTPALDNTIPVFADNLHLDSLLNVNFYPANNVNEPLESAEINLGIKVDGDAQKLFNSLHCQTSAPAR